MFLRFNRNATITSSMRNFELFLFRHLETLKSESNDPCESPDCESYNAETDNSLCIGCTVHLICYELNSYLTDDSEEKLIPSGLLSVLRIPKRPDTLQKFRKELCEFIKPYSEKVGHSLDLEFAKYADLLLSVHDSRLKSGYDMWWSLEYQTCLYFHIDLDDRPENDSYYTTPVPPNQLRSTILDDPIRPVHRFVSHGLLTTHSEQIFVHEEDMSLNSSESNDTAESMSYATFDSNSTSSGASASSSDGYSYS